LTVNGVGDGRVYHLGWYPAPEQAAALMRYLTAECGLTPLVEELPPGLVASQRGEHLILINYTERPLTARVKGEDVTVDGRDVVVTKSRAL
jgi:hypothetical protein